MEAQELDMDCRALLGSLTGLSRIASRSALTETVAGLEAELAPWTWPVQCSAEGPLLPDVELDGAIGDINKPISGLMQLPPSPYSTACYPGDAASRVPADQLSSLPLSSCDWSGNVRKAERARCSLSLTSSAEGSETLQLPPMLAASLAADVCKADVFWDVPWDEAAMRLCGAATPIPFPPPHSLNSKCCQAVPVGNRHALVDHPSPIQRAGSTDTEASCASTAVQRTGYPLQTQACLSTAPNASLFDTTAEIAAAPAEPPSLAELLLLAAARPGPDEALALSGSAAEVAGQPRAAAGLVRYQARARPAPANGRRPPRTAADSVPGQLLAVLADMPAPAAQLDAAPKSPTMTARPRALGGVQKVRQRQQAYSQRKRVRVAAVHAHVEELMERLAALECDVGGLLDRHEELTRDRPWYQQHEEINFMARLAGSMPASAVSSKSETALKSTPDVLKKLMLEPTATVNNLCGATECGILTACLQSTGACKASALAAQPTSAQDDSSSIAWSSVLVCLRLSKLQRDSIAGLYEKHLQDVAAAHQDCLSVASKLQVLPTVRGELTDCIWPNMAGCLVSSQLSSLAGREAELIAGLTTACQEVLNLMQQRNLQALAPAVAEDMRALCRELSANCRAPRKAPFSGPQPATHAPLGSQVASCHKTLVEECKHASFCGRNAITQAAIMINVAAHAARRPREAPAPGSASALPAAAQPTPNDVIADVAQMPNLTQLAVIEDMEPAALGNASALKPAAAVEPACDGVIENAGLMAVVAQLAAVSSEAAFRSVISAAVLKRRALASPGKIKGPSDDNYRHAPGNVLMMAEEEAATEGMKARPQSPFRKCHRKKARKIGHVQLPGNV